MGPILTHQSTHYISGLKSGVLRRFLIKVDFISEDRDSQKTENQSWNSDTPIILDRVQPLCRQWILKKQNKKSTITMFKATNLKLEAGNKGYQKEEDCVRRSDG